MSQGSNNVLGMSNNTARRRRATHALMTEHGCSEFQARDLVDTVVKAWRPVHVSEAAEDQRNAKEFLARQRRVDL